MADRKISDLTALTTPASGDYLPIVDISEAAAASKNKRITIEELMRGVPDGTAAAPGIAFETTPSTGIYSPGADQLAVATNGTGRLFVDASGLVGVNTSSPNAALTVNGVGAAMRYRTGAAADGRFEFAYNTTDVGYIGIPDSTTFSVWARSGNALQFGASNVERMRITAAGLVGIGVSSPESTLHCVGATVSEGDAAGQLVIRSSSAYNATPKSGIIFQILQDSSSNTAYVASIHAVKENTGDADRRTSLVFGTRAISGTTAERMRIDSSGNVGINTATPSSTLHVEGTSRFVASNSAIFNGTTGTYSTWLYNGTAVGDIGTGNQVFSGGANTDFAFTTRSTTSLVFGTNTTERARIDSSGRLLVGTSTSTNNLRFDQKLAVVSTGSGNPGGLSLTSYPGGASNEGNAPVLDLQRSRGSTDGSLTKVESGDALAYIHFRGTDGSSFLNGATISALVDGTTGTNDLPTRLVFSTTADGAASPTERMRITNNGHVLVGYTSSAQTTTGVISAVGYAGKQGVNNAPDDNVINFFFNGNLEAWVDTTNLGNVTIVSDYRIKKDITSQVELAIPKIKALRPVTYQRANYKELFTEDGVQREGFIAHELALVIPSAVSGEKDAENRIQSLNLDAVVSVLTKALQEAIAKIETLEARLTAAGIE